MALIRRFVNIVTENCKSGVCSVHRLDVSKHLFYPTTSHAQQANTNGGMVVERLQELPAPCTCIHPSPTTAANGPKMAFFGLVSPSSSESRILCISDAGHSMIYDADTHFRHSMPSLQGGFKGPVSSVSLSVAPAAGAKEQDMYVMHTVADGQELKSRFDVLRFGTAGYSIALEEWWYRQSLPPPPFVVSSPGGDLNLISSYMVLEGGRTICLLSSAAESVGTTCYLFDTVRGEWSRARDLGLPFAGRAEYVADLNIWLGFSAHDPRDLCSASGHYALVTADKPPKLLPLWQDRTPVEWKAAKIDLINLGSGRFAIAKVCKVIPSIGESGLEEEDKFLVLTGVEIRRGLQTFQHKSIGYICNNDRIHQVL